MKTIIVTHNELGLRIIRTLVELDADIQTIYTRTISEDISDHLDIKSRLEGIDIPINSVDSMNIDDVYHSMKNTNPDLLLVAGWSELLKSRILDIPNLASLGFHPAPLPRGRGRAPIAWSLIKGLNRSAMSLFHLVEEADAGDIVGQEWFDIDKNDDASSIYAKSINSADELIREYYPKFEQKKVPRRPQNDAKATWWPKREPHHGLVDWRLTASSVYNWIRGSSHPYPGAFSYINDKKVRLWDAESPSTNRVFGKPGEILSNSGSKLEIATWESSIVITRVQIGDNPEIPASHLFDELNVEIGDAFVDARDITM